MIKEVTENFVCTLSRGLRVMNAALITKTASLSDSKVTVECRGNMCSASNMLSMLSLGVECGDVITVSALGEDAEETIRNVSVLIQEDVENIFRSRNSGYFQATLA